MGLLIDGQWRDQWYDTGDSGRFQREEAQHRHWITADGAPGPSGEGGFAAEPGRYHLYVSLACPWAHRTLILRELKNLQPLIGVSVVSWLMRDHGWTFDAKHGASGDALNDLTYLHQRYKVDDAHYTGRVTVPLLWDTQRECIVSNESAEIIRMLNGAFDELTDNRLDFYPEHLRKQIDALNDRIYPAINNGVYRAGFATCQAAYEEAFDELFATLDSLDASLGSRRYLAGEHLTEADIRLFTSLIRFDAVYHGHFKCNLRLLEDYPNLSNWLRELYQWPGVAKTVDFTHIKSHYYASHATINPTGVIPKGPSLLLERSHDRERLPGKGIYQR
ncbi:putative glutathione S-transferase [Pseudomonas guineae]|uniref:Putative glutathione S-transferase n=1 Tax=Pseudomonas guineae TaxID=425504 RepID=A0A1I3HZU0_9PSED|nr:glutathione S-transferase family protein [Pseudomonas guineae]SFI41288.1 putative glutathione S-transferase [Pseudomonas guineae]|tara:strand:- start:2849 stop:3847 length:999 start_codon:yes stop_codon:yes gene_type:complete